MNDRVPLTDFTSEVLFEVGDVPIEIAEDYIRKAAIDLCKRANILQRKQRVPLWATVCAYVISAPEGERVHAIMGADYTDECGTKTFDCQAVPWFMCGAGQVSFALPDRMFMRPAPQCDNPEGLLITTVNVPTQDACDIDRSLYERYYDAIRYGAIAQLLMVSSAPWYNDKAAGDYLQLARNEQSKAGIERVLGPVRRVHRIIPRRIV